MNDLIESKQNRRTGSRISIEEGLFQTDESRSASFRVLCETHGNARAIANVSVWFVQRPDESTTQLVRREDEASRTRTVGRLRAMARYPWEWCPGCAVAVREAEGRVPVTPATPAAPPDGAPEIIRAAVEQRLQNR